ncbi:MAG: hypothetical protein ACHREM_20225 [Polyangiales bacterium]
MKLGRWVLRAEPEITRALYAKVDRGGSDECPCDLCENFVAARDRAFPDGFLRALDELGVDPRKEIETTRWCRVREGVHRYGGWFHAVAVVESGDEGRVYTEGAGSTFALERLADGFSAGVLWSRLNLVRPSFRGHALVEIEFDAEVPWVIATPEPAQ